MRRFADGAWERLSQRFDGGHLGAGIRLGHVISISSSVAATLAVTAALGFPFWWVAARLFSPASVGIASAAISAMVLLGNVGGSGIGSVVVRELPRVRGAERALLSRSVAAAGLMGAMIGVLFALAAPALGGQFGALATPLAAVAFAAGVSLTAISIVADQACIVLLRGALQFGRNLFFALLKIALLLPVAVLLANGWLGIYGAWVVSLAGSIGLVFLVALLRRGSAAPAAAEPGSETRLDVGALGASAVAHLALNLALQVPTLGMPVLVTAVAGAEVNAAFYVAWLVASAAGMVPLALASTLYAIGSRAPAALPRQMRLTLGLSAVAAIGATLVLAVAGGLILGIFGPHYVSAAGAVALFAAGSIPTIVKNHFQVLRRLQGRVVGAAVVCAIAAAAELAAAAIGLQVAGLLGLGIAWLAVLVVEAVLLATPVWRVLRQVWIRPPASASG